MKKIVKINNMHCNHCVNKVLSALNDYQGVDKAKVSLEKGLAVCKVNEKFNEEEIKLIISEVGFEVESIEDKKGLFS